MTTEDPPYRPYPREAEEPVVAALREHMGWYKVRPVDLTRLMLKALTAAGWRLGYPEGFPGVCGRCNCLIQEGTHHRMFNGNQMFACEIVDGPAPPPPEWLTEPMTNE